MNDIGVSKHSFASNGRDGVNVEGVTDVISFDDGGVVMETTLGNLAVEGEGLHVKVLDIANGRVEVEGRINGVYYFENTSAKKRGLFGRKND